MWRNTTGRGSLAILLTAAATAIVVNAGAQSVPSLPPLAPAGVQPRIDQHALLPTARYKLSVDMAAITHDLGAATVPKSSSARPLQVGISRPVRVSPIAEGKHFRNADGSQVIVYAVKSPGAVALRVHFTGFKIPAGDEVFVRGANATSADSIAGPYCESGSWNDGEFWSAIVEGDTAVIEYHSKSTPGVFTISEVSHLYRGVEPDAAEPDVLPCEVDASCSSAGTKNAVGRILFVSDSGGSYVCSGTLLNNSNNDRTPYFLTANHCISSQTEARSIETYWLYQTTACNNNSLRTDWIHQDQGANLLATSRANDSTLLRMIDSAPPSVAFAGWTAGVQAVNSGVFALHHPGGGLPPAQESFLRRAVGGIDGSPSFCADTGLTDGYEVEWFAGGTEGGSSGSGLFTSTGNQLVGVLSCGANTGTCAGSYDFYGKFSSFYPLVSSYLTPALSSELGNAVDAPNYDWRSAGAAAWYRESTVTHDAIDAASSGHIAHSEESWLETTIAGPGTLRFWWKVSSEPSYDVFYFTVDGLEMPQAHLISGEVNWSERSVPIPAGNHVVRWTYAKSSSVDGGSDEAWLDQVSFGATTPLLKSDFNADGHADLVWENRETAARAIWLLRDGRRQSSVNVRSAPLEWQLSGAGDFDSDGYSDLAWRNKRTGQAAVWFLSNGVFQRAVTLPTVATEWNIGAVADFNADGYADIAWQNTRTGAHAIWFLRNGVRQSSINLASTSNGWQIAAAGDFDADGHGDLAWQNTFTGERAIWFLQNGRVLSTKRLRTVGTAWQIAGATDFNVDGYADLVWQNASTGERVIWFMRNGDYQTQQSIATVARAWEIRVH